MYFFSLQGDSLITNKEEADIATRISFSLNKALNAYYQRQEGNVGFNIYTSNIVSQSLQMILCCGSIVQPQLNSKRFSSCLFSGSSDQFRLGETK